MEILFEILFVLVLHIEVRGQGQNSSTGTVWDSLGLLFFSCGENQNENSYQSVRDETLTVTY